MELLAGARDEEHLRRLRRLILGCRLMPVDGLADYEHAASIDRSCRRAGVTIRRLVDCLIATVAIKSGSALLHADADFDLIARHTSLTIARHGRPV
jgi:predicted nucleic acid-binding protein